MSVKFYDGIPVFVPNTTKDADGYYVSYNDHDRRYYGSDTTAIVVGNCRAFLILNGDHRDNLDGLTLSEACAYFHGHAHLKNHLSDPDENFDFSKICGSV